MGEGKSKPKKRGPAPKRVKIKGDWETAVGKALKKERPKEGWPMDSRAQRKTGRD
jgi:hypothetical protein